MRGKERGELSADESCPHFLLHGLQCEWLVLPLGEELWTDHSELHPNRFDWFYGVHIPHDLPGEVINQSDLGLPAVLLVSTPFLFVGKEGENV